MAARASRTHRDAVTRMLRSTGLANVPEEAPLVALVKTLAAEMDTNPGARTRADYLSALKDVRRALDGGSRRSSRPVGGTAEPKAASVAAKAAAEKAIADAAVPKPTVLAEFKQKRGITA